MTKLLSGIRVLELGRFVAAPSCGQLLADLGAEVIKVERPQGGDQIRQYGPPFLKDRAGVDTAESSYFLAFNRNKRSITVDLAHPEGQEVIKALAGKSDVLIENFKAGDLARFGLDAASLRQLHPQLVYLSITGFGQSGPYAGRPALDSVFQAMGGLMSVTGEPDAPPTKIGVTIVDIITGLYAVIAILAALRGKEVAGAGGQAIDLALLDVAIAVMSHRAQDYLLTGDVPTATGTKTNGSAPAQVFRCRDGWINIQAGDDHNYRKLCRVLGRQDLIDEPRYRQRTERWKLRAQLLPILEAEIAQRPVNELYEQLVALQIVCSPVYTLDQTFRDPQVIHRGARRSARHALGNDVDVISNPIHFGATPIDSYQAAPLLGQHTTEVLQELLGADAAHIAALRRSGAI